MCSETRFGYFPTPEIDTGGETFLTYYMDYVWFIKLFHKTGQGAYSLGHAVMTAIRAARNLIPLIAEDGSEVAGSWVRINDPQLKVLDDGAAQLTISWRSRRPYSDTTADRERAHSINVDVFMKSGKTISDAYGYTMDTEDTLDALGYTADEVLADPRLKRGIEKAVTEICGRG